MMGESGLSIIVIAIAGEVRSTVKLTWVAAVWLPALSVMEASKVWTPCASPLNRAVPWLAPTVAATRAPSSRTLKLDKFRPETLASA